MVILNSREGAGGLAIHAKNLFIKEPIQIRFNFITAIPKRIDVAPCISVYRFGLRNVELNIGEDKPDTSTSTIISGL